MKSNETKKPNWLKKLEDESWQAELIISGVAIFGALQLPNLIVESALGVFPYLQDGNMLLFMTFAFVYIAALFIICSFILHFIIRTVWIGLIGLNSVYPDGINGAGSKSYSKIFLDKLLQDYPPDQSSIQRLDNFASGIFAFCTYTVMTFIVFIIDFIIFLGIRYLLGFILPEEIIDKISIVIGVLFYILIFTFLFFNMKRNHENVKIQSLYYSSYTWFTKIFFHIFNRPITYLSFTFMSNAKVSTAIIGSFLLTFPVMFYTFSQLEKKGVDYLSNPNKFYDQIAASDRNFPHFYEDELKEYELPVWAPFIESRMIHSTVLEVFIPIKNNESDMIKKICGEYQKKKFIYDDEMRKERRAFNLACYRKYHKVYLNDSLYNVNLVNYNHPYRNSDGLLGHLPIDQLPPGENVLKIEKLSDDPTTPFRTATIPFYISK